MDGSADFGERRDRPVQKGQPRVMPGGFPPTSSLVEQVSCTKAKSTLQGDGHHGVSKTAVSAPPVPRPERNPPYVMFEAHEIHPADDIDWAIPADPDDWEEEQMLTRSLGSRRRLDQL